MKPPTPTAVRSALSGTYSGYSVGCALVWTVLLAIGRRVLDEKNWDALRLGAGAWWTGWLSATIARVGYPPPRPLSDAAHRRLEKVSLVLVMLGFAGFIRGLITGRRPASRTPDGSS